VIKRKGKYSNINEEIRVAVVIGRKTLNEYTRKMDSETLILYAASVLDPRVKTHWIKTHLEEEDATTIIDQLRTHFKEILLTILSPSYTQSLSPASSSIATPTSFVGKPQGLQVSASRSRILNSIQQAYYSPTLEDKIDVYLNSPPVQYQMPGDQRALDDLK